VIKLKRFILVFLAIILVGQSVFADEPTYVRTRIISMRQADTTFDIAAAATARDTSKIYNIQALWPIVIALSMTDTVSNTAVGRFARTTGMGIAVTNLETDTARFVLRVYQSMFNDTGALGWVMVDTLIGQGTAGTKNVEYVYPRLYTGLPFVRFILGRHTNFVATGAKTKTMYMFYRQRP
jgi:hypothetical protein